MCALQLEGVIGADIDVPMLALILGTRNSETAAAPAAVWTVQSFPGPWGLNAAASPS